MVHCLKWFIILLLISCTDNTDDDMRLFISSLSESSGAVIPTPLPDYDYLFLPTSGQSLSVNAVSAPYINPISSYAYKFSNGLTVAPNGSSTLVPLTIENDVNTNMLDIISSERSVSDVTKLVTMAAGVAGAGIASLSQGTTSYNKIISGVTELKRIADAEGKTMNCPAIGFIQGETDQIPDDTSYYSTSLQTLIADFNTDIKAITGQANDIKLVITQMGSHGDYGRYPSIALQQLAVSESNANVYLCKAMYNGDYVSDQVHGTTQLYGLAGAKMGYQIYESILLNYQKQSIQIQSHSYSALKSTIVFDVPHLPLAFDTTEVQAHSDSNYGFKLFDVFEDPANVLNNTISEPTPIITGVILVGGNTVEITYDSDPTGFRLTYGINAQVWNSVTGTRDLAPVGRTTGARGNLRDSQGEAVSYSIYNSSAVEQYNKIHNWTPIFEIQL